MDHTSIIVYQRSASHRCLAGCALLQPSLVCRADMVLSRGRVISSPTAFIKMLQTNRGGGSVFVSPAFLSSTSCAIACCVEDTGTCIS